MADELKAGTVSDNKVYALPLKPHLVHITFSTAKSVFHAGKEDMQNPRELFPSDFASPISMSGGFLQVNGGSVVVKLEEVKG